MNTYKIQVDFSYTQPVQRGKRIFQAGDSHSIYRNIAAQSKEQALELARKGFEMWSRFRAVTVWAANEIAEIENLTELMRHGLRYEKPKPTHTLPDGRVIDLSSIFAL